MNGRWWCRNVSPSAVFVVFLDAFGSFTFFFMQSFACLGMRVCKTAVAAVLLKQGIDGECDQEKSTDR